MAFTDSQRKARAKYREKVEKLQFELYPTDEDIKQRIAERVEAGEAKAAYIKRLIRADMGQAQDDRIVRCKDCRHYTHSRYVEFGYCGLHSEGETYVDMAPNAFCSYGERKVAKSEPIIDRATFEQFQENLKANLAAKASTPSTAAKRPLPTITHRQTSEIPDMPPLGYKWQDGMLVKDEAEAELIKRGYREMAEHGQVSMETQREIRRALLAKIEAWRKKHQ